MAISAVKDAIHWPGGTPAERLALVVLCEAVNEKRIEAGYPADVWLSQRTLAERVGVTDRQVRRILRALQDRHGVIADTGSRVGRGAVKWEVLLDRLGPRTSMSTLDTGVRPDADVRGEESPGEQVGHQRPTPRTSETSTPDADDRSARTPMSAEPEGNPENLEPENERGSAPPAADACTSSSTPSDEASALDTAQATQAAEQGSDEERRWAEAEEKGKLLASYKAELKKTTMPRLREATERRIAVLEQELGVVA